MDETPSSSDGAKRPPWVKRRPELFRRRGFVDQLEETQKRVRKALNRAWQGHVLNEKQIRSLTQVVLLDLLSSMDPLARAIAASELVAIERDQLQAAKDRAARAAKKRDIINVPVEQQVSLAEDFLSEFIEEKFE
jgi:hypothetical protein